MSRADKANECFNSGFNCAQSVFTSFSTDRGIDGKTALKIAASFGGGMGHIGGACGAVTGAFMVLGLIYGQDRGDDKTAKEKNYELVKEFTHRFKKLNGTISCKELLGYDISDENQLIAARKTDIFKTKCPMYIRHAVQILEEILSENETA